MEKSNNNVNVTMNKKSEMMDGSDIMELVENEKAFNNFVDHKFRELDKDRDGRLSVQELQPVVADIGAALGLPERGSSTESDHVYSEVLDEFTHGKQEKVGKKEFKVVLSDVLIGMAAGLKRDPIVILRIDGDDLHEFLKSQSFELEVISIFSEIQSPDASLQDCIIRALEKLTVDQGMPPASDPWVRSNIIELAMQSCVGATQQPVSQEQFLHEFRNVAQNVAELLRQQPVIVAHTENTFDGSGIRRLLSNKFELDKTLEGALEKVPKDGNGKMPKEYLRVVLDSLAASSGLPPLGAVEQMDKIINEAFKVLDADDGKLAKEEEFKKLLTETLGSVMLQLEGNPVSVSTNSVVHEPMASASTLLEPAPAS